jgi:hypothetical protein
MSVVLVVIVIGLRLNGQISAYLLSMLSFFFFFFFGGVPKSHLPLEPRDVGGEHVLLSGVPELCRIIASLDALLCSTEPVGRAATLSIWRQLELRLLLRPSLSQHCPTPLTCSRCSTQSRWHSWAPCAPSRWLLLAACHVELDQSVSLNPELEPIQADSWLYMTKYRCEVEQQVA